VTLEYLEVGERSRPRWQGFLVGAVVLIALTAAVVAWWSGRLREQANESLGLAIVDVSRDARAGEDVVLSMLQYTSPAIWSTMVGEDVRAGMRGLVQSSADEVVRTLQETRAAAAGTFVVPWDDTQQRAKAAVLDLVDAHLARFERIARDAKAIGPVFGETPPSDDTARALLRASGANLTADR